MSALDKVANSAKIALVALGPEDEYLGIFDVYTSLEALEHDLQALQPLLQANTERRLSLEERVALSPKPFPSAHCLTSFIVEDLEVRDGFLKDLSGPLI